MNLDVIGLDPDNAIGIVLKQFDERPNQSKLRLLLDNRPVKISSQDLPVNFSSGMTIDINSSELIGLGAVVTYFNWLGESTGNTYQAVVGLEDSAKPQVENILSDGAIWHDQEKIKMPFQQAMVQGYFPSKKLVSNSDIVKQIQSKAQRRSVYPDHCGLIVNIFSEQININIEDIRERSLESASLYDSVFIVVYYLPQLDFAKIIQLNEPSARNLELQLKRYPIDNVWQFNFDDKRGSKFGG